MGRHRLRMKLIENSKMRQSTFLKRRSCLFKKANELSTLCDLKLGIILFPPPNSLDDVQPEAEIWHRNTPDIKELIHHFKKQPIHAKTTDLSTFFKDHINKAQTALSKLQKNNEALYPTWNPLYNDLSEQQLRELVKCFDAKLQAVKARLDILNENYGAIFTRNIPKLDHEVVVSHPQPLDQAFYHPQLSDQDQHAYNDLEYFNSDLNSQMMTMAPMNDSSSDFPVFGCALPPLDGGAFYDNPVIGMAEESVAENNPVPLMYTETAGTLSQIDEYDYYDPTSDFSY